MEKLTEELVREGKLAPDVVLRLANRWVQAEGEFQRHQHMQQQHVRCCNDVGIEQQRIAASFHKAFGANNCRCIRVKGGFLLVETRAYPNDTKIRYFLDFMPATCQPDSFVEDGAPRLHVDALDAVHADSVQ